MSGIDHADHHDNHTSDGHHKSHHYTVVAPAPEGRRKVSIVLEGPIKHRNSPLGIADTGDIPRPESSVASVGPTRQASEDASAVPWPGTST